MNLREIFDELIRYESELTGAVDTRLREAHELPLVEFDAMRIVEATVPCRVFDLSSQLVMTSGAVSKLVDRIVAAGYCRRKANPYDARSTVLELTAAGRRMLAKAGKTFDAELSTYLGDAATARQLDLFGVTLQRLRAAYAG
ncbi:MAG: MarR family winged helix-turn-helix transcriptional regulator [Jatrophihabitantaceae bacterium]